MRTRTRLESLAFMGMLSLIGSLEVSSKHGTVGLLIMRVLTACVFLLPTHAAGSILSSAKHTVDLAKITLNTAGRYGALGLGDADDTFGAGVGLGIDLGGRYGYDEDYGDYRDGEAPLDLGLIPPEQPLGPGDHDDMPPLDDMPSPPNGVRQRSGSLALGSRARISSSDLAGGANWAGYDDLPPLDDYPIPDDVLGGQG